MNLQAPQAGRVTLTKLLTKRAAALTLLLALSVTSGAGAISPPRTEAAPSLSVVLDGIKLKFDVPPKVINGSTLVPMRRIFEALGAGVYYENKSQTVTATRNQMELIYKLGTTQAVKNGWPIKLTSQPGRVIGTTTMVPLRFVSESLGATVGFNAGTQVITIDSNRKKWGPTTGAAELSRYRLTLPNHTMLTKTPAWLAYLNQQDSTESHLFFGDSTTYGSYLGRSEALPALVGSQLGQPVYNLGVPGFSANEMIPLIQKTLKDMSASTVVIQLQTFWGASQPYTGLDTMLKAPLPAYPSALSSLRTDMSRDDEKLDLPYPTYAQQGSLKLQERIARGKQLFYAKSGLDPALKKQLELLRDVAANRPEQSFFIYVPPYLTSEMYKHTTLTKAGFEAQVNAIRELLAGQENIAFKDFNQETGEWNSSHFIDWIHRSQAGEKKLAEHMSDWLNN
ncbi:stalk domain-containing protein [Paenibacillus swuensis]|uniref:stalk domain-containing protein n=1 Tax=Paenibacillus swuensis TaxID=1178515 RepID=UPI0008383AE8|nr:stalk domain-containing protein [Paenibacillus swuensis]